MIPLSKRNSFLYAVLAVFCAILLSVVGLQLLTRFDNKYTAKTHVAQDETTVLPENGVRFLVDGWELYPDRLLEPADFDEGAVSPRYRTWVGEYPNLALFHEDGNPYGVATYRLLLRGEGMAALYLQEPQCAARVFVDGVDLGGSGEVSPSGYRPLVRDTMFAFKIQGVTELVVQTANYSHYYGGLWFPPAVGDADSVGHMVASRMVFYGFLCFSGLTLALFCVMLWLRKKEKGDQTVFYFGLLCLSFTLRVCYPFLRLWGVPLLRSLYALEDTAALLGLYCCVRIALLLFVPNGPTRLHRAVSGAALAVCFLAPAAQMFLLPAFPPATSWYGLFISWYKVLTAVFLAGAALCGCALGQPNARPALAGITMNGVCLLYGTLTIGRFEPIVGGWPEEYGAFGMVMVFAVMLIRRSLAMAEENRRLHTHMQEEIAEKTRNLGLLLVERDQLVAELGHDMKSPLTALSNMTQIIRLNNLQLSENTDKHLQGVESKCRIMAERLHSMQELMEESGTPARMELLSLNQFIADFYRSNKPVVELTGPDFFCRITPASCVTLVDKAKLSRALENLVYNAGDFTPPDGRLLLSMDLEGDFAAIRVSDTGCGIPSDVLPHIFQRFYTTRPDEGGQGLGLAITNSIVLEHRGTIDVESTPGAGTVFTIRLPIERASFL